MSNVIIGIHGLGNKPPLNLLAHWWKLSMNEGLKAGNYKGLLPDFKLVYWADILHKKPQDPNEKDIDSPWFLDERYIRAPEDFPVEDHSNRQRVVNYLGQQMNRIFLNKDLTLNYSFISDAIINRYFKELEVYYSGKVTGEKNRILMVKEAIWERLADTLMEHKDDNIMLIGHSMGSVIAFDVLTFLVPEVRINTFITMGSPLGLPVIISKIAAGNRQRGIMSTILKTPPGVVRNWYNFSDILDKVAFNYKLSDYYSENRYMVKPVDSLVINNYELEGIRNPHKSFGYLRTPEFSGILNEFILSEELTAGQKINRRVSHFIEAIKYRISKPKH